MRTCKVSQATLQSRSPSDTPVPIRNCTGTIHPSGIGKLLFASLPKKKKRQVAKQRSCTEKMFKPDVFPNQIQNLLHLVTLCAKSHSSANHHKGREIIWCSSRRLGEWQCHEGSKSESLVISGDKLRSLDAFVEIPISLIISFDCILVNVFLRKKMYHDPRGFLKPSLF